MTRVALVCMPWHPVEAPSLPLGVLQAVMNRSGTPCRTHPFYLDLLAFVREDDSVPASARLTLDEFREVGDRWFLQAPGQWLFAKAAGRSPGVEADRRYLASLRRDGMSNRLAKRLQELRRYVPEFVERCADAVLEDAPDLVGFTTSMGQTIASLALAQRIRERRPDVTIVFGGASCEGEMGDALHRTYDCIDVVVRGEGEAVLPRLVAALDAGKPFPELPGLCLRRGAQRIVVAERPGEAVAMQDVPAPDYAEDFERRAAVLRDGEVQTLLPYESSRGCWWGERSHCTFCGLNAERMQHRTKAVDRIVADLTELAERHRILDFTLSDNIMAMSWFEDLLPRLRELPFELQLFYQTKANLSAEHVARLHDAGVKWIRPGIESLSTEVLQLMRKGVTAVHNVRTLRRCAELGIHTAWNLLYGIPGESPEEYRRMAEWMPALVHLPPPGLAPLTLDRFSPYHREAERHGVHILGAPEHLGLLHAGDAERLRALSWTFAYRVERDVEPEEYIVPARDGVARWRAASAQNRRALTVRRGPGFATIRDLRPEFGPCSYVLDGFEADVHAACERGVTEAGVVAELRARGRPAPSRRRVAETLAQFTAAGLLFEEHGRYVSLALAEEPFVARSGESGQRIERDSA